MHKAQCFLGSLISYLLSEALKKTLILMSTTILLLFSNSSFGLVINPVATESCAIGDIKGGLANADYAANGSLLSSFNSGNYINVAVIPPINKNTHK